MLDGEVQESTKSLFFYAQDRKLCAGNYLLTTSVDLRLWFTGLIRFHCNSSFESSSERNLSYVYILNLFVLFTEKN